MEPAAPQPRCVAMYAVQVGSSVSMEAAVLIVMASAVQADRSAAPVLVVLLLNVAKEKCAAPKSTIGAMVLPAFITNICSFLEINIEY